MRRPARAPHTRFQDARDAVATRSPLHQALKDPSLYGTTTHCCDCERQVDQRECVWVDTGEDLQSYAERLAARHV